MAGRDDWHWLRSLAQWYGRFVIFNCIADETVRKKELSNTAHFSRRSDGKAELLLLLVRGSDRLRFYALSLTTKRADANSRGAAEWYDIFDTC